MIYWTCFTNNHFLLSFIFLFSCTSKVTQWPRSKRKYDYTTTKLLEFIKIMQMFPLVLGFVKLYYFLNPNVSLFKNIDTFLFLKTVPQTEQHTKKWILETRISFQDCNLMRLTLTFNFKKTIFHFLNCTWKEILKLKRKIIQES